MVEIMEKASGKSEVDQAQKLTPPATKRPTGFEMMRRVGEEFDRLWDDLAGQMFRARSPGLPGRGRETLLRPGSSLQTIAEWSPRVEIVEREGELLVRAELPGMSKDDVKVEVTDELITIEGERKAEAREEKEGYFYSERSYGHFFRSIPMPEGAESEKARATFQDGVLEVTMPVPEQPSRKPKRIEIAEKS
jgi:HSP20 family protein